MRIEGSRILVTGGTGSIGSEIVRQLLERSPAHVVIFSRDDSKHFYFQEELSNYDNITFIIGNVRDKEALTRAFSSGIDIVIHAAALKHVLICEQNPIEAVKTNILGTQNIVDLAKQNGVEVVLTISTDKAVAPTSTMGATKYIAEKLTIDGNLTNATKFACVRFGNVLGSRGSVIPSMVKGIRERGGIWISDERVTRFAMPVPDAAKLVIDAIDICSGGEIFVLKMKSFSLGQLVRVIRSIPLGSSGFKVVERGLIRAEKLHEDLVTSDEVARLWSSDLHYIISPPVGDWTPKKGMNKMVLEEYNSSNGDTFSDEELATYVSECVVELGLD